MPRALIDYTPEMELPPSGAGIPAPSGVDNLSEAQELELASTLLEVDTDSEFGGALNNTVSSIASALGVTVPPAVSHTLGSVLQRMVKEAVPGERLARGGALLGSHTDSQLASAASHLFGLELEGLSPEDQEFEFARRVVRFAAEALNNAAAQTKRAASPHAHAHKAVAEAARRLAPGVLKILGTAAPSPSNTDLPRKEKVMHDIDRTQLEFGSRPQAFEAESFEFGEAEQGWPGETLMSEAEEEQYANELLGVSNEEELEQFLGDFIKKIGSVAGKVIHSPVGQAIGGVLKGVAKKALPLAGGAIGGFFGGPLGAKIGSGVASAAGSALGLEAEAFEQEDREVAGAKQFVRLAADAVKNAAAAPATADPRAVAQSVAVAAAKKFAPGLLSGAAHTAAAPGHNGTHGRWMRRGNRIVLIGV
jgi:uncharacterized protein (DUF697 family)